MAWTSDEYIGVGLRLPLFSVQGVGHQVNAFGNNQTVAVIVNVTTGNDLTIVSLCPSYTSELHLPIQLLLCSVLIVVQIQQIPRHSSLLV